MRFAFVAILSLTAIGISGAHAEELLQATDGSDILAAGFVAEKAGALDRAESLFKQVAILPDMQEKGTIALAHVLIAEHRREDAERLLKTFVKDVNPFSVDAHIALLDIALTAEQNGAVEEEMTIISKLRPGYEPFQERRAILAFRAGDYQKAAQALTSVLSKQKNYPRALSLRYKAYLKLGMYAQAAADLEHLIKLAPAQDQNYWVLASVYAKARQNEQALNTMKRGMNALQGITNQAQVLVAATIAYANLAEAWIHHSDFAYAKQALKDGGQLGVRAGPAKARLMYVAGELMEGQNNFQKAEEFYQRAFMADPRHIENGLKFAETLAHNGAPEKASHVMAQVVALDPDNDTYVRRLIDYYKTSDRKDQLGTFLKNFLDSHPTETWALVEYVRLLASIDSLGAAESVLARAIETDGASADVYLLTAKVLDKQGKHDDAIRVLTAATPKFPKDGRVRFDMGLIQERAGNFAKAEQAYRSVPVADAELYYQAHVNLGLMQEKAGAFDKALNTFSSLRSRIGESDELVAKIRDLTDRIRSSSASPIRKLANEGSAQ